MATKRSKGRGVGKGGPPLASRRGKRLEGGGGGGGGGGGRAPRWPEPPPFCRPRPDVLWWAGYYGERMSGSEPWLDDGRAAADAGRGKFGAGRYIAYHPLVGGALREHMLRIRFDECIGEPGGWRRRDWESWYGAFGAGDFQVALAEAIKGRWRHKYAHEEAVPDDGPREVRDARQRRALEALFGLVYSSAREGPVDPWLRYTVETGFLYPYLRLAAVTPRGIDWGAADRVRREVHRGVTPEQMGIHMEARAGALKAFARLLRNNPDDPRAAEDARHVLGRFEDTADYRCDRAIDPAAWRGDSEQEREGRCRAYRESRAGKGIEYIAGTELVEAGRRQVVFGKYINGATVDDSYACHPALQKYIFRKFEYKRAHGIRVSRLLNRTLAACILRGSGADMLFPLRFVVSGAAASEAGAPDGWADSPAPGTSISAPDIRIEGYEGAILFPLDIRAENTRALGRPHEKRCTVFPLFVMRARGGNLLLFNYLGAMVDLGSLFPRRPGTYTELAQLRCMMNGESWKEGEGRITAWRLTGGGLSTHARQQVFVSTQPDAGERAKARIRGLVECGLVDDGELARRVSKLYKCEVAGDPREAYLRAWESLERTFLVYDEESHRIMFTDGDDPRVETQRGSDEPCFPEEDDHAEFRNAMDMSLMYGGGGGGREALNTDPGLVADRALVRLFGKLEFGPPPLYDGSSSGDGARKVIALKGHSGDAFMKNGHPLRRFQDVHVQQPLLFLDNCWRALRGHLEAASPPRVAILSGNGNFLYSVNFIFETRGWDPKGIVFLMSAPTRTITWLDVARKRNTVAVIGPFLDEVSLGRACEGGREGAFDLVVTDCGINPDPQIRVQRTAAMQLAALRLLRPDGRGAALCFSLHSPSDPDSMISPFAGAFQKVEVLWSAMRQVVYLCSGTVSRARLQSARERLGGALTAALRFEEEPRSQGGGAWKGRRAFETEAARLSESLDAELERFVADPRPREVKGRDAAERVSRHLAETYGKMGFKNLPTADDLLARYLELAELQARVARPKSRVRGGGAGGGSAAAAAAWAPQAEVARRVFANAAPKPYTDLPRVLDHESATDFEYSEAIREPSNRRCHWGQRKLFFAELDFLTRVFGSGAGAPPPSEFCAVYVGAAPGEHQNVLLQLFPDLEWQMYDGGRFRIDPAVLRAHRAGVRLFSGAKEGFFTDATVPLVRGRTTRPRLLFISDIRLSPAEEAVCGDLASQRRWGEALAADWMLLKMRLPYEPGSWARPRATPGAPLKRLPRGVPANRRFLYLDGELLPQVYAPVHSNETRLMVRRLPAGGYALREYDIIRYQDQLFFFNEYTRATAYALPGGVMLSHHLPGYDNGFESATEFARAEAYLRLARSPAEPSPEAVVAALAEWDAALSAASFGGDTRGAMLGCARRTLERYAGRRDSPATDARHRARVWGWYESESRPAVDRQQARLLRRSARLPQGPRGRILDPSHYEAGAALLDRVGGPRNVDVERRLPEKGA